MTSIEKLMLARKVANAINDWLYEEQLDELHEICYHIVREGCPELNDEELWDLLPEVFDRLHPFTAH